MYIGTWKNILVTKRINLFFFIFRGWRSRERQTEDVLQWGDKQSFLPVERISILGLEKKLDQKKKREKHQEQRDHESPCLGEVNKEPWLHHQNNYSWFEWKQIFWLVCKSWISPNWSYHGSQLLGITTAWDSFAGGTKYFCISILFHSVVNSPPFWYEPSQCTVSSRFQQSCLNEYILLEKLPWASNEWREKATDGWETNSFFFF